MKFFGSRPESDILTCHRYAHALVGWRHPTYYTFYQTDCNSGATIFTDNGIAGLVLPASNREAVVKKVMDKFPQAVFRKNECPELKDALLRYFRGEEVEFNFPLDLTGNSYFEKNVFSVAREIPYGERRSYSWIGCRLGKPRGYRAVGNALGENPMPVIIPCHRVVRKGGSLGGFSAGMQWKNKLLELESST